MNPDEDLEAWTVFNPTFLGNDTVEVKKGGSPGTVVITFRGNE